MKTKALLSSVFCLLSSALAAQTPPATPVNADRLAPAYPVPYAPAKPEEIKAVLDRVLTYLESATPVRLIDRDTKAPVADPAHLTGNVIFDRTDFLLSSYEWGVTYAGMLHVAQTTSDEHYRAYVTTRLAALTAVAAHRRAGEAGTAPADEPAGPERVRSMYPMLHPHSLDDCGAMCAALLKAARDQPAVAAQLRPWIDNYMKFISTEQFRFADGTLARNRPLANALWLDDLYMSVPALAQMGAFTGETKYFDDAVKQITQFSARMFVPETGLYRHGWVQAMDPHPAFYWARANGWAVVAMAELLSVLPEDHPGRAAVLAQYRAHVAGLVATQSGAGLWHQLLNRNDSYLETSASAMYVYAIARGINRGWLDALTYGPTVSLGWNAVAQKVNAQGQVEGTCIGTGMGFDPAFYYYRPTSVFAAHGYGPVLLAGAEVIELRRGKGAAAQINGGGVQLAPSPSRH